MWFRALYHPEINYALRQTLVLAIPVALGFHFDRLQEGMLFSLIPACCNYAGLDTPHKRFFRRIIVGGCLFATTSFILQWLIACTVPLPLALALIVLLLGVTAELGALHSRLLPGSLVAMVFTLSLVNRLPPWAAPSLYLAGTLWYGVFTWLWFKLCREQPLRETLCLLYRQLADYCDTKYRLLITPHEAEKLLLVLLNKQQKVMDLLTLCQCQLSMLTVLKRSSFKRMAAAFQVAIDIQEHITVNLGLLDTRQKLLQNSLAAPIIRWNANTISGRVRELAEDVLYHQPPRRFNMKQQLGALRKIAQHHPNNPAGGFYCAHFERMAKILTGSKPRCLASPILDYQSHLPLLPAIKHYLSWRSSALRIAARYAVMLTCGSVLTLFLHVPKPYWVLMTILFVSQENYTATRVRIQHRALGTLAGLAVSALTLRFPLPQSIELLVMLIITLASYLIIRKFYGLGTVGLTITAVYSLNILSLDGAHFLLPRLLDTLIGCLLAFAGTLWLWPQWQSQLLSQNAHNALEAEQQALCALLSADNMASNIALWRLRVNQAHNTLCNSLSQAMKEPGFDARYLADVRLWVTHNQCIVEHINAMSVLASEQRLTNTHQLQSVLNTCEYAIQLCQQRLQQSEISQHTWMLENNKLHAEQSASTMENHVYRILSHLNVMHTVSTQAWCHLHRHTGLTIGKSG